jgi:hypothetical protein
MGRLSWLFDLIPLLGVLASGSRQISSFQYCESFALALRLLKDLPGARLQNEYEQVGP